MRIKERLVSRKMHTIGFVLAGEEVTRHEAVRLASKGYISNAKIVNSNAYGKHLVGTAGDTLYDLPARFPKTRRFANKRNK